MALPYVDLGSVPVLGVRVQPYGVATLLALASAALTAVLLRRRFAIPGRAIAVLAPCAILAALVVGHVGDVVAYQAGQGGFSQLASGHALFGALIGVALVALVVALAFRLVGGDVADLVALATLVAMTIGRVGCALVHDHPGAATDSAIGVDFPIEAVRWLFVRHMPAPGTTVRLHDLGLDELLLLVPITAVGFFLAARRLRAGSIAIFAAIAYAAIRFPLDFLRREETDPLHAGLTAAQWGCLLMLALAVGVALWQRAGRGVRQAV
jgi:phosphatidylglycerol:prolipoprotein diacylglycerol transferase